MSLAELNIYVKAYKKRKNKEWDDSLIQNYLLSRWVWTKKVDYKKYLNTKKIVMSNDEMYNQVKALNTLFGGDVIG